MSIHSLSYSSRCSIVDSFLFFSSMVYSRVESLSTVPSLIFQQKILKVYSFHFCISVHLWRSLSRSPGCKSATVTVRRSLAHRVMVWAQWGNISSRLSWLLPEFKIHLISIFNFWFFCISDFHFVSILLIINIIVYAVIIFCHKFMFSMLSYY
jgi:hypothetical protein